MTEKRKGRKKELICVTNKSKKIQGDDKMKRNTEQTNKTEEENQIIEYNILCPFFFVVKTEESI